MALFPFTLALAFAMMTALWPLSRWLRHVSIIDILWAPAFAALTALCAVLVPIRGVRGWIVLVLVTVWAAPREPYLLALAAPRPRRLSLRRDPQEARGEFSSSLFWIFWLQAALLWVISWPLQAVFAFIGPLNGLDVLGIAMTVAGILIEALADAVSQEPGQSRHGSRHGIVGLVAASELFR